jgi:hypothetical protein
MNDNLPTSAMGVMRLLPDSKTGIERFSMQLINAVKSGEVNPLQLKALFKALEKVAEIVDGVTKPNQMKEASMYAEKKFNAFGFEIEKTEVGTKYDYLSCGDPVYEQRHAILESAKRQLDERVVFLKSLKEPMTLVDEGSGEVVTVRPPVKTSTEGLKFSLK